MGNLTLQRLRWHTSSLCSMLLFAMSIQTRLKEVHGSTCSLPLDAPLLTIVWGLAAALELVNDEYSSPPSFPGDIWSFAAVTWMIMQRVRHCFL